MPVGWKREQQLRETGSIVWPNFCSTVEVWRWGAAFVWLFALNSLFKGPGFQWYLYCFRANPIQVRNTASCCPTACLGTVAPSVSRQAGATCITCMTGREACAEGGTERLRRRPSRGQGLGSHRLLTACTECGQRRKGRVPNLLVRGGKGGGRENYELRRC